MKTLSCVLFVLLMSAAHLYKRFPDWAAQQWFFYIMGGIEKAALWSVVGWVAWCQRSSVWRTLLMGTCFAGVWLGSEQAVCGVASWQGYVGHVRPWHELCGELVDMPLGGVEFVALVFFVLSLWGRRGNR